MKAEVLAVLIRVTVTQYPTTVFHTYSVPQKTTRKSMTISAVALAVLAVVSTFSVEAAEVPVLVDCLV